MTGPRRAEPAPSSRVAAPSAAPAAPPIAIIGMACMFPQAPDLQAFWNNILSGVDAISEPVESWGAERYLEAGRIRTQFGGYLRDLYRFDPREFGIMPNSLDGGEPDHFLALRVARDALADAGYAGPEADHGRTGIILGHSTYLHRGQVTVIQHNIVLDQTMELLKAAMPHLDDAALAPLRDALRRKLPPSNSDNAPGIVPNVMTGRIANRLNLRGPNYILDAACSSSLLAVASAIDELRAGRSRMMLAGGVNASLPADVTTSFTQLGALSARGRVRPFEAGSDGTLLGEGLGILVLKRLHDAMADGDRVYAVIRGVGQASDGRGTGLLAPSQAGETLAIRRAYEASGVDPSTIGLVEAHGTGIPLGDKTEIAALREAFGERSAPVGTKALGSVKSMISHCIPAAGSASLIKMALSLHHKVLPATLCDQVNPELGIEHTPFFINTRTAPWVAPLGRPRRAAVNAFGFGGINSHAILEEAPPEALRPRRVNHWPAELLVLSADTRDALANRLDEVAAAVAGHPEWRLVDVAAHLCRTDQASAHRLVIVAKDLPGLVKSLAQAATKLRGKPEAAWSTRGGIVYADHRTEGRLAFLFPGEGSQYPEMFADLALCFDGMQQWLDFWHGLYDLPPGATRTDIVFPSVEVTPERRKQLEQRMHDMDVGSEAVFIGGMAMHELLQSLGVEPDVMVGHSSGESAALGASRAIPADTPAARAACIAQHYAAYETLLREDKIPTGALLAVGALPPSTVEEQLAAHGSDVVVAMDNCANQMVLYGSPESIAQMQKRLAALGGICLPLPFDRGYHTPAFADASRAFLGYYGDVNLGAPQVPLYSCASAGLFPTAPQAVRELAAAQWSTKVRFRETVLKMHDDGVRLFVEVGPSANLTAFVNDILIERDATVLATNQRRKGGVEQLLTVLGQLYVAGRGAALERLFADRAVRPIAFDAPPPKPVGVWLDNTMPMLRLTEADRELLRGLALLPTQASGGASPGFAAPAAQSSMDVHAHAHVAGPATFSDTASSADLTVADTGATERVMGDYFDVMRGFLEQQRAVVETWPAVEASSPVPSQAAWASTHASDSPVPLLDTIVVHDTERLHARCKVSLENDRFIRDHVLSGRVSAVDPDLHGLPCVALMASVEAMAEAAALLAGRLDLRVIESVKAFDWVALDDGELVFDVHAETIDRAAGHYRARLQTPRGVALSAEFRFEADWRLGPVAPLVAPRASRLTSPNLYEVDMFHGPVFQTVRQVEAWDDTGIDVRLSPASIEGFFAPGHTPKLVLNPALLDAMAQVVPCWFVEYVGIEFHSFPSTIERIELYEPCPANREGLVMRARQQPEDPAATSIDARRAWQFECTDGEGRVLMRVGGLVNLFFRVTPGYHQARTQPLNGWLGRPYDAAAAPEGVALWQVPMLPDDLCTQSGGICLRILAHTLLDAEERDEWRALKGSLKHRREWLFGRAALKEAVRHHVWQQTGELLYATDIVVRHDEHGAPFVDGWWCGRMAPAPSVSLSHEGEVCLAAVGDPGLPVGVDLGTMGRVRRPELLMDALAPGERALVAGLAGPALEERLLRLWCAKEAAAKCTGMGLQGRPEAFCVIATDDSCDRLHVDSAWGRVETWVQRIDSTIIALGLPVSSDVEVHG